MIFERVLTFYKNRIFEKAIFFSSIFLSFKLLFPFLESFLEAFITEFLLIHTLYFWLTYIPRKISVKQKNLLTLFSTLIILGFIFLAIETVIVVFLPEKELFKFGFFYNSIVTFVAFILSGITLFVVSIFKRFFFLKQKSNPSSYFKVMVIFAALVGFSNSFSPYIKQLFGYKEFLEKEFFSVNVFVQWITDLESILQIALLIIIIFNSFRVAWIATLNKSEKKKLIFFSFLLIIIYANSFYFILENSTITKLAYLFSPFLYITLSSVLLYASVYSVVIFFTSIFHLPTAEEADRKSEELSTLLNFGKLMNHILDLNELEETILAMSIRLSKTDAGWFYFKTKNEETVITNNIDNDSLISITKKIVQKIDLSNTTQIVVSKYQNIYNDLNSKYSNAIIVKFEFNNERAIMVLLNEKFVDIEDEILQSINGLRDYAVVALKNATLVETSIEKERMEKELELAREIQEKINPQVMPKFKMFDVSARFIPAFEVGGDYYDFFKIGNRTAFIIADVSGKGMEASYIMAEMKGVFETLAGIYDNLKDIIIQANKIFVRRLNEKSFITAIIGLVNDEAKCIEYYRLGHNLPLIFNGKSSYIKSKGLAFGITDKAVFEENLERKKIVFDNDTQLIFYTDGISESMDDHREEFGYDRLAQLAEKHKSEPPESLSKIILTEISVYSNKTIQQDDITILIFKKNEVMEI